MLLIVFIWLLIFIGSFGIGYYRKKRKIEQERAFMYEIKRNKKISDDKYDVTGLYEFLNPRL